MGEAWRSSLAVVAAMLVATACGPGRPTGTTSVGSPASGPAAQIAASAPRGLLKIAWGPEPPTLGPKLATPGASALNESAITFNSALAFFDPSGLPHPQLAQELPSMDRGDWIVRPDGTMVTTYRLRSNARWHDGAPLTARDFAFAYQIYSDAEVPVARRIPENIMAGVEATDATTLVITWKQAYYNAGALRYQQLDPLPSHLLEEKYRADKVSFATGPHWTTEYVGSGPFRVERWDPGTGILARAFTDWVLGPPKVAALDIRFINDSNTILANLLSGDIDVSGLPWTSPSLAASVRDRWIGGGLGTIKATESRLQHMDFQYREVPNGQPALHDVRVRQALISGLDREGLTELVNAGLGGSVGHVFMLKTDPLYPGVEQAIAKYPYDPSTALALLADAGWRRPGSGGLLANAAGQALRVESWLNFGPDAEKEVSLISDNWKRLGIDAPTFVVPGARATDAEFLTSFPGTLNTNRPITIENFIWTSSNAATAQSRWQGNNRGSVRDSEIDRMQNAVLGALTPAAARDASEALHRYATETVAFVPLYYPADIVMARTGVKGPAGHFTYPATSWNIFEWEVAP